MRDRTLDIAGRRLRVRTGGTGPGLVLIHGFASGIDGWPAPQLEQLGRTRTFVALDLPGHGGSDPVARAHFTPADAVEVVAEVAHRILGPEPVDWCGYSMGARLALSAVRLGVPIRGLMLESANPGIEDPDERRARADWDESWAERFDVPSSEEALNAWLEEPIFKTRRHMSPTEALRQRRVRQAADGPSLAAWLRGFGTGAMPDTWEALVGFRGPIDLLVGELDEKYVALANRIEASRDDVRISVVPGVGHAPHMEAAEQWLGWLSARRTGDSG